MQDNRISQTRKSPDRCKAEVSDMTDDQPPITAAELAKIKARADAATPGPWWLGAEYRNHNDVLFTLSKPRKYHTTGIAQLIKFNGWGACATAEDATFIASSRDDIPRLVAEVERLREMLDVAMDYTRHHPGCSAEFDAVEPYRCRCGWRDEQKPVRAYLDAVSASTVR